jgi:hypothetical protein
MTKRNPAASVRARLLNKARADGVDYQLLLTRYGLERSTQAHAMDSHENRPHRDRGGGRGGGGLTSSKMRAIFVAVVFTVRSSHGCHLRRLLGQHVGI